MSGSTCGQCADCQSCIACELEPPGNTCWITNCTDSSCGDYATCIQGCSNPGCYQGCNRTYPMAAMQAGAATGCACNACAQCQGQCGPPH